MDQEEIVRLCASLSLKSKEEQLWSVQDSLKDSAGKKLDLCLMGKVLSNKHINRDAFRTMMLKIPNAPLMCMTKEIGEFIGKLIGELKDIDVGLTRECFGKYMRLKVEVDVSKSLKRFLRLELEKGKESILLLRQGRREEVWRPRRETVNTVQQQLMEKGTPVGVSEAAGLCGNKGSEEVLISSAQEAVGMGDDQVLEGGLINEHCGTNVVFELNDEENPMQMERPREPLNGELSEVMHANKINVLKEASSIINSGVAYSLDASGETRTLEATDVHQKKGNWKRRAREGGQKGERSVDILRLEKRGARKFVEVSTEMAVKK
ncbi:hypothetical protein EZV62_013718 [Acer yangbiense]|uniref:Uncharacterized protein n=1 Tax=Acer yangbiense TaxID=1000413 RepID=A0A5C7HZQ7_9ROSI|nr:hypothetical protein EZV62_013718 [Acer yangbiense]